jgi:type I restriction enzyme S subunit
MIQQTKQLPEGWKEVELSEIFIFEPKSGKKAGEGQEQGKYKFFTSSSEQTKFIDDYTYEGEHLIFAIGGQAGVHYCNEKFSASNDCFVVKVDNKVSAKYVYYFLFSNLYVLEAGFKGAGLKHLSRDYLANIKIIYPEEKKEQKRIVSILEKAEALKQKREDADKLTNEYLQSVFYEMFGDSAKNPKKLPIRRLEEATSNKGDFVDGPFGSDLKVSHHTEEGVRILQINNIGVGKFLDKNAKYVSEEKYNELIRHNALPGDIIIAKMGEPIARTCILPIYIKKALVVADCMRLRVTNKKEFNSIYLSYLLNTEFAKSQIDSMTHGSTRIRVNLSMIKNLKIPLPPIELQNKFASIVEHVEKIKEKQKKSKEEINDLFNSLMQRAFNGELVR